MQYDSETPFTETFNALSLSQPLADELVTGTCNHFLMKVSTLYRGELLIVARPDKKVERSGMMVGKVNLTDCKKVEGGYLWKCENPRRVVEMPCQKSKMKGQIWKCHYTEGEVIEYPSVSIRRYLKMPDFNKE